ncbi:hypothetical protein ACQ856_18075 [Mycolicibacterium psychrotolerans]|uniref:hypothetical protein n=1 Tax=Mycolicibacterium psychrotolerans TaxID=216929 RepID=UPI003D669990
MTAVEVAAVVADLVRGLVFGYLLFLVFGLSDRVVAFVLRTVAAMFIVGAIATRHIIR